MRNAAPYTARKERKMNRSQCGAASTTSARRARLLVLAVLCCASACALALAPPLAGGVRAQNALSYPASGEILWDKIVVRTGPSTKANRIAVLTQFRPDFRRRVVLAVGDHVDDAGKLWYRINLPGRPNGRKGWVRAAGVHVRPVTREIRIDRSERKLQLWDGAEMLLEARVAVGRKGMETPLGSFYVTSKFVPTAPILGAYALETSAYSKVSD